MPRELTSAMKRTMADEAAHLRIVAELLSPAAGDSHNEDLLAAAK